LRHHRQHQRLDLLARRPFDRVQRATTRSTLVSTAATCSPKAIAAIAGAV
jgi:hypothetical protein